MLNRCPPRAQEKFVKNFTLSAERAVFLQITRQKATINCQNPASRRSFLARSCQAMMALSGGDGA
jgi:hypothetical protein